MRWVLGLITEAQLEAKSSAFLWLPVALERDGWSCQSAGSEVFSDAMRWDGRPTYRLHEGRLACQQTLLVYSELRQTNSNLQARYFDRPVQHKFTINLTMVSPTPQTKHIACARCRDRKVKCDGGKPGCKRCHRNGAPCQYIRGRKQQTRSEWLQHLRTFSSQPGTLYVMPVHLLPAAKYVFLGRTDVARSLNTSSSQPDMPQTPRLQPHYVGDTISLCARSPSPYLFEHTAIEGDSDQSITLGSRPITSRADTEDCSGNASWPPMSTQYAGIGPRTFYFEPSTSFADTYFVSDLLTTASRQAQFSAYPAFSRSLTPTSTTSETTSSYDELSQR